MSIVVSKVAEPYAEALLNLAKANDTLKETTNDMNIVSQFLAIFLRVVSSWCFSTCNSLITNMKLSS